MRRFCWRERSEKLNWRLLGALDVADVVRRGDPAVLEPYALHVTFARLPSTLKDPTTRDAWFLVRVLQLAMEYLLFMRARDGDVLESLSQELRQVERERDELVMGTQKWKARARSGDKQVENCIKCCRILRSYCRFTDVAHGVDIGETGEAKRRALMEKTDEDIEEEARVCGFCGKLFSSTEYLEKHLVRRHGGESMEVETPVKHKMRRHFDKQVDEKENKARMRTRRRLKLRCRRWCSREATAACGRGDTKTTASESKLAEDTRVSRLQAEQQQESQRQLDEISLQKQKAEDELADLKQQIQFFTLKKKMMGAEPKVVQPINLPHNSDDALIVAEMEIRDLQQTLETVNAELTSAREELMKVQALHLSALRKKKELADKLALSRGASPITQQNNESQTNQPGMINATVQTDEQSSPVLIESVKLTEPCTPLCADVGTDSLILSYEDVGIQTTDLLQEEPLLNAEVEVSKIDNLTLEDEPASSAVAPELILDDSAAVDVSSVDDTAASPEPATPEKTNSFQTTSNNLTSKLFLTLLPNVLKGNHIICETKQTLAF
ncbi:Zinc finger protein DZIP1, N-terminal [Phytophthora cactorum]|nr:Zinc finger protein DZIP1, N-terminal [Phytophthora cactorum]